MSDEITLLNRADMFIFASAALRDYYIANGLKEKPYLIQNIPDYMTDICANEHKNKKLYIMAETSQNEYPLNNLNIEVVQYDEYRAIPNVMERIFMHYYELCDREDFKPQYEYIKMTEVK